MIEPYEVFLRAEAIQSLRSIPMAARRRISNFIDLRSSDPALPGDYSITDSTGRIIEIEVIGSHHSLGRSRRSRNQDHRYPQRGSRLITSQTTSNQ